MPKTVCRLGVFGTGGYLQPYETTDDRPWRSLALRTRQTTYPRPNKALPDFVKHTAGFALIQHELNSRPIPAKESPRFTNATRGCGRDC